MPETLTVLMPVRDGASYLEEAVASIVAQRGVEVRLLAIDDGSTDGSAGLLERLGVEVLRRPREGLAAALNAGLALVQTPLVARMDADDRCHPERLAAQVDLVARCPKVGVVATQVRMFPAKRVSAGMARFVEWQNQLTDHAAMARNLLVDAPLAHGSCLLRTSTLRAAGGWCTEPWPEDLDLFWRLVHHHQVRLAKVPRPLYEWREHPGRTSRVDPRLTPEAFLACKLHHLRSWLAGTTGVDLWGYGATYRAWRAALEGLFAVHGAELNPRRLRRSRGRRVFIAPGDLPPRHTATLLLAFGTRRARDLIGEAVGGEGLLLS